MNLGNFSVSLTVKDLAKSKAFYQTLGFTVLDGNEEQGWLILQNGETNIGLFQGMFEKNILTFNPGWDSSGKETQTFTDIRQLQKKLQENGVQLIKEVEHESGPDSITLEDPDGNPILIDQHRS